MADPTSRMSSVPNITVVVPDDVEAEASLSNQPSNDEDDTDNGNGDNS